MQSSHLNEVIKIHPENNVKVLDSDSCCVCDSWKKRCLLGKREYFALQQ